MEHPDSLMAARVWQRVQGKPVESAMPDIFSFLQEESADLSRYLQLQVMLPSSQKAVLQQLIQTTRHCIAILRGSLYLQLDTLPELKLYPIAKELPTASLRRLYGDTLRRYNRYAQWRGDNAFGIVFTQLEAECQKRCVLILRLLGQENSK